LLKLAKRLKEKFKVSFSISGLALEQFELVCTRSNQSFQKLAKTGCVEFLSETYSHSLSSLKDKTIFEEQVKLHNQIIFRLFGQKPRF
jgi:alpha-amylase